MKVEINTLHKTIDIKKLPLGKYAELLGAIKELPKHLNSFEKLDNAKIIDALPQLISSAMPDFIHIMTIATELDKKEIESIGLDEAVDIVLAVIEVNNYKGIYQKIKKVTARPTK